ncbi:Uncharacterized protein OBRU01_22170, partial [Operophtera brumata]
MNRQTFVTRLKDKIQYFEDNSSLRRFGHVISIANTFLFKRKNISPALYNFAKEITYWTKSCKFCVNCKMNKSCVNEIVPLVEAFRSPCEEMLTDCWWNDEQFSLHSPDEIPTVASENNLGQCGNLPVVSDFEVSLS